jgi:hypothetical protein
MTEPIQHYGMRTGCADSRPRQLKPRATTRNPCACPRERATLIPATPSPSLPVSAPLMATNEEGKKRLHSLSEREYEVLVLLARGQSVKHIALSLSHAQHQDRQYLSSPSLGQAPSEEDNRPIPLCQSSTDHTALSARNGRGEY